MRSRRGGITAEAICNKLTLIRGSAESNSSDFAATEASVFMNDFSIERLISECLSENDRRMSQFDPELLQPRLLLNIAAVALSRLRLLPKRSPAQEH